MAQEMLGDQASRIGKVTCYSATEIDPSARDLLAAHKPETRPLHIFGDIKDRLWNQDRRQVTAIVNQHNEQLDEYDAWLEDNSISTDDYDRMKRRLQFGIDLTQNSGH